MAALNPGTGVYDGDGQGVETYKNASGEALAQGVWVYQDPADSNKFKKADNATAIKANVFGITLNGVSGANMTVTVKRSGRLKGVATMGVGVSYHAAPNASAGQMEPTADVGAGDFATYLGYAAAATEFEIQIHAHAVAVA